MERDKDRKKRRLLNGGAREKIPGAAEVLDALNALAYYVTHRGDEAKLVFAISMLRKATGKFRDAVQAEQEKEEPPLINGEGTPQ